MDIEKVRPEQDDQGDMIPAVQPYRIGTDADGTAVYRDPITGDEYSTGEVEV